LLALLRKRDQIVIIKLNLMLRLKRSRTRRDGPVGGHGCCHRKAPLGPSSGPEANDALPPLASGFLIVGSRDPIPKARLQPDLRAQYGLVMEPCQPPCRKCKIPYTSAAAAVATLSEPTLPRRGRHTISSHAAATLGRRP